MTPAPIIIAVAKQKGGVGKTTSTVQIAHALRKRGKRVLVIDLDMAATDLLLGPLPPEAAPRAGTHEILIKGADLGTVAQPAIIPRVDSDQEAPGALTYDGLEVCAAYEETMEAIDMDLAEQANYPEALRRALGRCSRTWDFILVDCPPTLGMLTVNALVAAHWVLTPVTPAFLTERSVGRLERAVQNAQQLNPGLRSIGYLLCMVDEREKALVRARAMLAHGRYRLRTEIRTDAHMKLPPAEWTRSRAVRDYESAGEEILRRIQRLGRKDPTVGQPEVPHAAD